MTIVIVMSTITFFLHLLFPVSPQLEEHDNYVCKIVFNKKKKGKERKELIL